MNGKKYDMADADIAWCPGCGDHSILTALKQALTELDISSEKLVIVSGIGQAAKIPHYLKCNVFNGLHGRALPAAVAIKAVNPELIVIAESGDGCMYGEGGNHFIHTIRKNPNITNIVHNNMVYGLTKGQASPTSQLGFKTPVQVYGVMNEPFNPIAIAITLGATFVARGFSGDIDKVKELIKKAILHKGYALLDILQPCLTFNKINTFQWYKEHTYYLDENYQTGDIMTSLKTAFSVDKLALGVIYKSSEKNTFEENTGIYEDDKLPLFARKPDRIEKIKKLFETKK